jgi:hypothetical protein
MTENEIITAAKTNWLAWQGLKELQPEVAAWMEGHEDDLIVHTGTRWVQGHSTFDGGINRLRPDYEQLKWWFLPLGCGTFSNPQLEQCSKQPNTNWLEVTAEYADYLRNKPDGEWELRKPDSGEQILIWINGRFSRPMTAGNGIKMNDTPADRGYRWCKPKPDIAQLRRELVEARARMMEATEAYLDAKHRLDGALRPSK